MLMSRSPTTVWWRPGVGVAVGLITGLEGRLGGGTGGGGPSGVASPMIRGTLEPGGLRRGPRARVPQTPGGEGGPWERVALGWVPWTGGLELPVEEGSPPEGAPAGMVIVASGRPKPNPGSPGAEPDAETARITEAAATVPTAGQSRGRSRRGPD